MEKIQTLSKLLQIRENEKAEAQLVHSRSVDRFEEVATKLYNLLKKKEKAEESFTMYAKSKTSIEKIKEQVAYIENLNEKILNLQDEVNQARVIMEDKQGKLTETHVEVKKFEKMIETQQNKRAKHAQKLENNTMDEISIQQYLATIR